MNIVLRKGMSKEEVNKKFLEACVAFKLFDEEYKGNLYSHNWICSCGEIIKGRGFGKIKERNSIKCEKCIVEKNEQRYKSEVEKTKEYEYIKSYRKRDKLPDGRVVGDSPYIEIKHIPCGKIYIITAGGFINAQKRCRCSIYEKSIEHVHPEISKIIDSDSEFNKVNVRVVHSNSGKFFYYRCPKCGLVGDKPVRLSVVVKNGGYSCKYCSDGISIPEKFMSNLLRVLNVEFEFQKVFEWCKNVACKNKKFPGWKQYDFYVNAMNLIIETHGIQHYIEMPRGRSLIEELENDRLKKEMALKSGIDEKNYIVIDCRESDLKLLKNNCAEKLSNIFDLSNIDWNDVWVKSHNSMAVESWQLWNKGVPIGEISSLLKLNSPTIRRYLNSGVKLNKCTYDSKKEQEKIKKQIICLTTGEIFLSISEAAKKYELTLKGLSRCCRSTNKILGELKDGRPLIWMHYESYLEKDNNVIDELLRDTFSKYMKKIKCLTTAMVFDDASKAAEYYGAHRGNILKCCKGERKFAGCLSNGTKLKWEYYNFRNA